MTIPPLRKPISKGPAHGAEPSDDDAAVMAQVALGEVAALDELVRRPHTATCGPEPNDHYRNLGGYSFSARYTTSRVQLTSITAFQRTFRRTGPEGIDVDLTPDRLLAISYGVKGTYSEPGYKNGSWTEELRLGSTGSTNSPLKWTVESFLFSQKFPNASEFWPFGGTLVFLGDPRTVGVTLSTRLWQ